MPFMIVSRRRGPVMLSNRPSQPRYDFELRPNEPVLVPDEFAQSLALARAVVRGHIALSPSVPQEIRDQIDSLAANLPVRERSRDSAPTADPAGVPVEVREDMKQLVGAAQSDANVTIG